MINGKKPLNCITSFTEKGYEVYGREFIETYLRFWPKSIRLTVYYEGENFPFTEGLSWRPIEEVEFLTDYMNCLQFPIMRGMVGERYDINFDAGMARKAFMEMHAIRQYGGKVFWLDADAITHSPVPDDFLDSCLPDDALNCYLGRDGWYYTESGFIGFNAEHPLIGKFRKNYLNCFISGAIFTQPGWHDCYGFDAVRKVLGNGPEFVNMAKDVPKGTMHPAVNTVYGKYMDHKKGPRKDSRSTETDLVKPRSEPYWQTPQGSTEKPSQTSDKITSTVIALPPQ